MNSGLFSSVSGKTNEGEPFFEKDIPVMYKTIRSVIVGMYPKNIDEISLNAGYARAAIK